VTFGFVRAASLTAVLLMMSVEFPLLAAQTADNAFEGSRPGSSREIGGLRFCWAPPGSFRMGSPAEEPERREDEGPVEVIITHGFWMGKYEITQGEWSALMGALPREPDKGRGPDVPVYWVSWLDADNFCRRLTEHARSSRTLPENWEIRLPTEAQWEYACRAGTSAATSFGPRLDRTQANIGTSYPDGNGRGPGRESAVRVGSYRPNAWGLHDMHGNVWEWCRDWYYRRLPGGSDPDLSAEPGERNRDGTFSRVRRGGA
jgi:formylglycine-generating enzyme required for sulfatase activity